jgi:ketol-acid reductoisomerase
MAVKIYHTQEAPFAPLKKKTLAVIGFGSQGHAQALNLKDNGLHVIVGLYPTSSSRKTAKDLGFEVMDTAAAVTAADVIFLATPDTAMASIYANDIAPHLQKGKTLLFAHGFAVHFKTVRPSQHVDVILVAPKGPGHTVRSQFIAGMGVPALIAIDQNPTGKAKQTALAWAGGIGSARAGIFETSFREETVTDLFGEQCVLCGGMSALVKAGFDTLVDAGYSPVMAYFECLHELKFVADLMHEKGISGMRASISETAAYGDVSVGSKIIDTSVRKRMAAQLKAIESGQFSNEWIHEWDHGSKHFKAVRHSEALHPIEKIGERLRSTMSWIQSSKREKEETKGKKRR